MTTKSIASADAPAKTPRQEAAEAVIALMAPGMVMTQMNVGSDAAGEPNMIVIYLGSPAV